MMNKKLTLPFKNMTPRAWQNLAIAATITFYLILMGSIYFGLGFVKNRQWIFVLIGYLGRSSIQMGLRMFMT